MLRNQVRICTIDNNSLICLVTVSSMFLRKYLPNNVVDTLFDYFRITFASVHGLANIYASINFYTVLITLTINKCDYKQTEANLALNYSSL
jgi:hypothetical protein